VTKKAKLYGAGHSESASDSSGTDRYLRHTRGDDSAHRASPTREQNVHQHAYGGYGFCHIDPKADGDTLELLQMLPSHRLDDVIFLEPGSPEFDRTVGINMLDMPPLENEAQLEKEIESRLENLIAIFDNDEYWGPKMGSITESMGRAMLRHNAQISLDPNCDPSEKYTVVDLYFILLNEMRREEFMTEVDDPYLREGLQ